MGERPPIEVFASGLRARTVRSVRSASVAKTSGREAGLANAFDDIDAARTAAARIKDEAIARLPDLLVELEERCVGNGIHVHWAFDAERAREIILGICAEAGPKSVVAKAKSMATEEIHLNHALETAGYHPVETDLGEFVVQIDGDRPSHIVTPIIHKDRHDVARSFARLGLGPQTDDPAELTLQARGALRRTFQQAKIGISGVNFAAADTGRLVLVENEGNNRYSTTAPPVHIALMGIEKVVPREADLPLFLELLVGSATGQRFATYVHFISGPKRADEEDGPTEIHLVLLDNGRSRIARGPYREVLRCIRCGACLNTCPVYRQATGHAYRHVYSGPIGAVLSPLLEGIDEYGDLAKASTLCGACEAVCPVRIPLPDILLRLRDEAFRSRIARDGVPWNGLAGVASSPFLWRASLTLLPMATKLPSPMRSGWEEFHDPPKREGRDFRRWWDDRS